MPLLRWHSQSSLSNTLPIMRFAVGKVKNPQPWVNSKTSSIYSFLVVSFHPNIVLCIGRASWLLREKRQVCIKSLRAVPSLSGMWFISSLVGSWFSNTLKYDFSHLSHYFFIVIMKYRLLWPTTIHVETWEVSYRPRLVEKIKLYWIHRRVLTKYTSYWTMWSLSINSCKITVRYHYISMHLKQSFHLCKACGLLQH